MINCYWGLDGEGKGRDPHHYTMLIAGDENGVNILVENQDGLHTQECLEFLVRLSAYTRVVFTYSFLYDLTKILTDLPDKDIYELFRPELRVTKNEKQKFRHIEWNGFELNWIAGQFTIQKGRQKLVIWDVFKFFQSSFVKTLDKWEVGDLEIRAYIKRMKDKREGFENESADDIRTYCALECQQLALLSRKLTEKHYEAGIPLTEYYGVGSTASVILRRLCIEDKRSHGPEAIWGAVMRAFFGGRFENDWIGDIPGPLFNFDISSAYPYQLFRLPCLEHGTWGVTTNPDVAKRSTMALIWWHLGVNHHDYSWGPFPFRTKTGTIVFPIAGGNGFCWREEFFAAQSIFSNVEFIMAYVYNTDCNCKPFSEIPLYYRERCRWGKDGAGIVLKLGPNACYGKLAQSVGNPKFNCWIWAGMITSNTRAQILRALANHDDYSNLVIVATDGIYTREDIQLETPEDTGTYDLPKPLGGWERKVIKRGMFAARPGVNFPLDLVSDDISDEDREKLLDDVKGRGFGRRALYDNAYAIREAYLRGEQKIQLPKISRFYGAKTSIWKVGDEYRRAPEYGTWYEYEPFLGFNPMPKRKEVRADGFLIPHELPFNVMSSPYKVEHGLDHALHYFEDMQDEQPS